MPRPLDLTGKRFGKLTAIRKLPKRADHPHAVWECACDCGKQSNVPLNDLRSGHTQSRGCFRREAGSWLNLKHGHASGYGSPEYRAWQSAKDRCHNPNNPAFDRYGGRGIEMCQRWRDSFAAFLEDMGERPANTSLDRYPDNNGNYELGNCRWASRKQQAENRRSSIKVEVNGMAFPTLLEASKHFGVPYPRVRARVLAGIPADFAVTHLTFKRKSWKQITQ